MSFKRGDANESELVSTSLIESLITFCNGPSFQETMEAFRKSNEIHFLPLAEGKTEEHDLKFTQIFNEYQDLCEEQFKIFAHRHNVSVQKIFEDCRDIADDKFTILFEEHEHKWFLDLIMSWMDYDSFVSNIINDIKQESWNRNRK